MARKKSEVERVAVSYTVLPATKDALRAAADAAKISAGEVVDRAVALYRGGASPSKDLAIERESEPEFPAQSYWGKSELKRLQDEYRVDEKAAMDMVFEFFKECGGVCPACRGRLGGIASLMEGVGTLQDVGAPPEPDGPETPCEHCGQVFRRLAGSHLVKLCPECFLDGHAGDVRECGACTTGKAI